MAALTPVFSLWGEGLRRLSLLWWRWARRELQHKNAAHPDLPRIVRRIRELERR